MLELEEIELDEIKELLKNKKFIKLKKYLNEINSADIPPLFDELNEEESLVLFRLLNKEVAAEVFTELDSDLQEKLIGFFTDKELKAVIDELFMDETVDLIEEMPSNVVKRILKNVDKEDRRTINELLNYPEDSAGSIMTTEFIDLKENMTVEEAFKEVKKDCVNQETIYNMYVLSLTRSLARSLHRPAACKHNIPAYIASQYEMPLYNGQHAANSTMTGTRMPIVHFSRLSFCCSRLSIFSPFCLLMPFIIQRDMAFGPRRVCIVHIERHG